MGIPNTNLGRGNDSTFGRNLMSLIASKLPYNASGSSVIDDVTELNPKYKHFYNTGTRRDDLLQKYSVSRTSSDEEQGPAGSIAIDKNYHEFMYANIDVDKSKRLTDYRVMAAYAEVADALDEICDGAVVDDETNQVVKLSFRGDDEHTATAMSEVNKEFSKLADYYKFEEKGWEYFRHLLVDGELYFEHIIHEKHKDAGILGVLDIPTELVDPIYDNVQNLIIKGYLLRRPIINPKTNAVEEYDYIPMDKHQVTYIHSGMWNEDKTMRLPFIENCRRSYRQLTMMEDAVVVHRLVRSPERLVFNVDVGNLSPPKAEAYLRKLMHNYWSRKTYDNQQGSPVNVYDPQSMLDSFWFAKRAGSEGSKVDVLSKGQGFDSIEDLQYFVKKLYKSLRVPVGRLDEASAYNDGANILREELKFARFLIRLQQKFAAGLKEMLVTHLRLKGLWDQYKLKEQHFDVQFNPPSSFFALREQQVFDLKTNNFSTLAAAEGVSQTYCMKKYLDWSDIEIKRNRSWLRKDKALAWELAQIEAMGPNWKEGADAAAEAAGGMGGGMGGGMPMGAPMDMGGELPPPSEGPVPGIEPGGAAAPLPGGDASALPE
jgi:hypothetical protein